MKNTLCVFLMLTLVSCAIHQNKKPDNEQITEKKLETVDYSLNLPTSWHSYLDPHGDLAFKPIDHASDYPETSIYLLKASDSISKTLTLQQYVARSSNFKKYVKGYVKEVNIKQTKFGESYVLTEKFNLNAKDYKTRKMFFKHLCFKS